MSEKIGRTLAIDLGSRRTGLAVCDALGIAIRTLPAVHSRGDAERLEGVLAAIRGETPERVLIGLPLHMDGGESSGARDARTFGAALEAQQSGLEIEFADERLTTVEAAELLSASGVRADRQRERIDSAAAAVLLRAWIDGRRAAARRASMSTFAEDEDATDADLGPTEPDPAPDAHALDRGRRDRAGARRRSRRR
ncbi:MAG: Holliday junction resolvase RuvX [Planctomycetes bacterium]|nr:Holliday junction resolvase RuvX [Planctomycetota bacterium]